MTLLEAIKANPVFFSISENHIESVLLSRSFDGSAEYSGSSLKNLELVTADLYANMALLPKFKEGQLSLEFDKSTLLQKAKNLYKKHDDPKLAEIDNTPSIEAVNV